MMKRVQAIFAAFVLVLPLASLAQAVDGDYKLHAGDSITVSVWKELDLQRKVIIRPDGRFLLSARRRGAGRRAKRRPSAP
jgi:protein involved in polysaccharide export with SLBB domain